MNPATPDEGIVDTPSPVDPESLLDSPSSPGSAPESPTETIIVNGNLLPPEPPHLSPRPLSTSATTAGMTTSSTPLGSLNAARRPAPRPPTISSRGSGLNVSQDIMARIKAVHLGRQGAPPQANMRAPQSGPVPLQGPHDAASPSPQPPVGQMPGNPSPVGSAGAALPCGIPAGFKMPPNMGKPQMTSYQSAPAVARGPPKSSLAEKRGLKLPGGLPGASPAPSPVNGAPGAPAGRKRPGLKLSDMNGGGGSDSGKPQDGAAQKPNGGTMMDKYSEFLDPKTGALKFKGKAVLTSSGVEFSSGSSFSISLDEVDTMDELGKGNYGTVYKVRHARPRIRKPGQGLAGNKSATPNSPSSKSLDSEDSPTSANTKGTGVIMAMKEIRLELDDAKFAAIIMELDILHKCISPFIIDFYGAFFQEGAVYICMEFMDGGSIDKLYGDGIPENVLRKITLATTMGLKSLKDDHNIIHRDVKPTNILMNTKGQVKICDFGVSGNLVASIAKTNIGCQSYMAPERISNGGVAQAGANPGGGTYSVQSDIWSLGLTIIECAMGRYPYPPETYNNIFSQLSAIVNGEPPDLPVEGYSDAARHFVTSCLNKVPKLRPSYAMLLQHAWLTPLLKPPTISEEEEEDESLAEIATSDFANADLDDAASVKSGSSSDLQLPDQVMDEEVARWVVEMIDRRKKGLLGSKEKPALHAAPLDAVGSPMEVKGIDITPEASA